MRIHPFRRGATALVMFALLADCGKSEASTQPGGPNNLAPAQVTFTTYTGPFANLHTSGTLNVAVADTGSASGTTLANGQIVFLSGATANLIGTYYRSIRLLALSGGGDEVTGNLANGTITGIFSEGGSSGRFAVQAPVSAAVATLYCGTYVTSNDYGWLSIVVSSTGTASGFAVALVGGTSVAFGGTVNVLALSATSSSSEQVTGTLSPDRLSITGSYVASGTVAGADSFQATTAACSTPGASTNAGVWATSAGGTSTNIHFAVTESLGALSGSGIITVGFVPGWTGDEFEIQSGTVSGTQVSFAAQLGANPNGSGGFYYGTLTFSGTISGPTMTGTVVFTPPRTATQTFAQQTVPGLSLTKN